MSEIVDLKDRGWNWRPSWLTGALLSIAILLFSDGWLTLFRFWPQTASEQSISLL
jgi:hypothetical protein